MWQVAAANVAQTSAPASAPPSAAPKPRGVTGVKLAFGSAIKGGAPQGQGQGKEKADRRGMGTVAEAGAPQEAAPADSAPRRRGAALPGRAGGPAGASPAQSLLPALFPPPAASEADVKAPSVEEDPAATAEKKQLAVVALNLLRHLVWRSAPAAAAALDAGALAAVADLLPSAVSSAATSPAHLHELLCLLANLLCCQRSAADIAAAANGDAPGGGQRAAPLLFQLTQLAGCAAAPTWPAVPSKRPAFPISFHAVPLATTSHPSPNARVIEMPLPFMVPHSWHCT